jgi:hypothetical protein
MARKGNRDGPVYSNMNRRMLMFIKIPMESIMRIIEEPP